MRTWRYVEPDERPDGSIVGRVIDLTDNQILERYYVGWARRAIEHQAKHPERAFPITPAVCIEDWATTNWAYQHMGTIRDER